MQSKKRYSMYVKSFISSPPNFCKEGYCMYYTKVNQDNCIACGLCQIISPDLFDYTSEGIAFTKMDSNEGNAPIPPNDLKRFWMPTANAQQVPSCAQNHRSLQRNGNPELLNAPCFSSIQREAAPGIITDSGAAS